jgi:hypothetical protein
MMTQRPRVHPICLSSPNMADYGTMSFPCKLYAMLEDADAKGFEDVISWQHGGRSFKVYNPDYFAHHVMQGYFAQTKFKSFQVRCFHARTLYSINDETQDVYILCCSIF